MCESRLSPGEQGVRELLRGTQLLVGFKTRQSFVAPSMGHLVEIMTDLTKTCQNKFVLSIHYISLIVPSHNDLFALEVCVLVLQLTSCDTLLAVCVPCCAVCHLWELGQGCHIVLFNTGL